MQPLEHGCVLLQLPLQAAKPLLSVRNCRAETVPAQRTPMTSAVKNIDLIFFMIALLLTMLDYFPGDWGCRKVREQNPVPSGNKLQKQPVEHP
ncbi:MAG TPA: hypothetical protein VF938_01405 [Candidatus Angelobacter sp.]